MKTMTTKELADALGITTRTVQNAVNRLGLANVLSQVDINGKMGYVFDEEQATAVKQEVQSHHNLATRQIDTLSTQSELRNMAVRAFAQMDDKDLVQSVMYGMKEVLDRTQKHIADVEADNEALRIELDKSKEWYSVKRMEALTGAKFSWRTLKRASIAQDISIKKVFDQNYGKVNVYHTKLIFLDRR